jgi:hypothetical protein
MRSVVSVLLVSSIAAVAAGCSISDSVSSPFSWSSDSVASSSRSSSRNRAEDYRNDVADYTQAQVQSGGDFTTFTRGLSSVAAKHGVSDWESDDNTYVGIGQGLKRAGATQTQVDVWETNLSHGDKSKASAIQSGYDSTQPGR